jgi:23S rRNA pseudouridine2457 synthase
LNCTFTKNSNATASTTQVVVYQIVQEDQMKEDHRYFMVHKPVNMVSQFISADRVRLLGDLDYSFPEGIHAIGRLDQDSEGLLLLTTNKKITRLLFNRKQQHWRSYLVQGDHPFSASCLLALQDGVQIRVKGGGYFQTSPCLVERIADPGIYHVTSDPRSKPGQEWLLISLTEGKFRQVRKMMAAIGQKTRRLIRVSIDALQLGTLPPGAIEELTEDDFFSLLKLPKNENAS